MRSAAERPRCGLDRDGAGRRSNRRFRLSSLSGLPDPDPTAPAPERETDIHALGDALGGARGVAESAIPGVAFVAFYSLNNQQLEPAAIAAVVVGGALTVARVLRGETLQYALSGLVGVAIAAFIATKTGRAEDFFLPGLFLNAGYALAYGVSIAIRWPLIGLIMGLLNGDVTGWREKPGAIRSYSRASWPWVVLFVTRLAVQLPLYLAGALVALATARVAMGVPLFLLGIWVTYLILRREGMLGSPAKAR